MAWEHFDVAGNGICKVLKKETDEIFQCEYVRGTLTTGKSRVFWGYQIIVNVEGKDIVGRSKGYSETYSLALKECNVKMAEDGLSLLVAGNQDNYSESAMTGPSGYGYLKGEKKAIDIMFSDL